MQRDSVIKQTAWGYYKVLVTGSMLEKNIVL